MRCWIPRPRWALRPPRRPWLADDILHALALASAFPRSGVCRHTARRPRRPRPVVVSRAAAWGARVVRFHVVRGRSAVDNRDEPTREHGRSIWKSVGRRLRCGPATLVTPRPTMQSGVARAGVGARRRCNCTLACTCIVETQPRLHAPSACRLGSALRADLHHHPYALRDGDSRSSATAEGTAEAKSLVDPYRLRRRWTWGYRHRRAPCACCPRTSVQDWHSHRVGHRGLFSGVIPGKCLRSTRGQPHAHHTTEERQTGIGTGWLHYRAV